MKFALDWFCWWSDAWGKRPLAGLSYTRVTLNHRVKIRPHYKRLQTLYSINQQGEAKLHWPNINPCPKKSYLSVICKFKSIQV